MLIEKHNSYAEVTRITREEKLWLFTFLQYTDENYFWAMKRRGVSNPPPKSFFDRRSSRFPSGLIYRVAAATKKLAQDPDSGISAAKVIDHTVRPCEPDESVDISYLRDYQQEAVWTALQMGRGLIKAPTGAGKSVMMNATITMLPCRHLIVVNNKVQLMLELAKKYENLTGKRPGIMGGGHEDYHLPVTFATTRTLAKAMNGSAK